MNGLSVQGLGQLDPIQSIIKSVVDEYRPVLTEAVSPIVGDIASAAKPAFKMVMDEYWLRIALVAGGIAAGGIILGTYLGRKI